MRLGIASIQRNRGRYLAEWISFHYLVGFRKFYIYLHKCTDDSVDVLNALSKKYDIWFMVVPDDIPLPQLAAYKHAYTEFNHAVDWIAFIDGDEFLFSPGKKDISETLSDHFYLKTSALCVHWVCFGSSGHIVEPVGLVTENFRFRGEFDHAPNRHVKSIVKGRQGSLVDISQNPHMFITPLGSYDENGRLLTNAAPDWVPTHKTIRINHYVTQSREFFLQNKAEAGTAMDKTDQKFTRCESWWRGHDVNTIYDDSMDFYLPELKKLMSIA